MTPPTPGATLRDDPEVQAAREVHRAVIERLDAESRARTISATQAMTEAMAAHYALFEVERVAEIRMAGGAA